MISSPVDEIKNRLDIVEVIGSYIKLQKAGANFRALCPFHSEKKPSFFVSPSRQIWHCFGCGAGGDIFRFVMQIEGVEFGDALRMLAQKVGVELKKQPPELRTERQRLYEISEWATRFFEKQLEGSQVGQEVKKYLLNRGITEDSIKKWRLGYSPDTWHGLTDFLVSKGYKEEEIARAGLAVKKDVSEDYLEIGGIRRDYYDRFRGRIIFPIFDLNSQVIGFGGRIFEGLKSTHSRTATDEIAKYINTPNTLLYDKSRALYGLDKAKVEIRKKDFCILVEGYTDVIMSHQVGDENVVATSGTALTPYQLKILKRYSENLVIAFDADIAGDSATKRGIDLAQLYGFNIKILRFSQGKDAAEIILKNPKAWKDALENQKSILDFYFETTLARFDKKTDEGKKEISKILLPVIKRIPNKIVMAHWIQKLAREIEVKEENIEEELKKVKLETTTFPEEEPNQIESIRGGGGSKSRKELLEERLLTMILKSPQNLSLIEKNNFSLFSPKCQTILVNLKNKAKKFPAEVEEYFNYLALKAEVEEMEEKEILPEIQHCLGEIQSLEIKNRLGQISQELKKAEIEKDSSKIEKLTKEFNQLAKEII